MAEEPKNFGEFLAGLIKARGVTQSEFAARANLSQPYVSQIVRGVRPPTRYIIACSASALEADAKTRIDLNRVAARDVGFEIDLPPLPD